jgi:hypothetical protein
MSNKFNLKFDVFLNGKKAGGIGGYIWGMDAMNELYRYGEQVEFKGYGGGSTGGSGAGGSYDNRLIDFQSFQN